LDLSCQSWSRQIAVPQSLLTIGFALGLLAGVLDSTSTLAAQRSPCAVGEWSLVEEARPAKRLRNRRYCCRGICIWRGRTGDWSNSRHRTAGTAVGVVRCTGSYTRLVRNAPPRWLPSTRYQVRRELANRGRAGAAIYGAILGIGVLTIVSTPWSHPRLTLPNSNAGSAGSPTSRCRRSLAPSTRLGTLTTSPTRH
jgi:hypothetical protein